MTTTLAGWVVVQEAGEGHVYCETFAENERTAIAKWVELAERLGHGRQTWDYWRINSYSTLRALLRLT